MRPVRASPKMCPVIDDVRPVAHARSAAEVAGELRSDLAAGLPTVDAQARLDVYGPNELARPTRPAFARIALHQLADPLVALLVAAAVVSFAVGEGIESAVIAAIVILVWLMEMKPF